MSDLKGLIWKSKTGDVGDRLERANRYEAGTSKDRLSVKRGTVMRKRNNRRRGSRTYARLLRVLPSREV